MSNFLTRPREDVGGVTDIQRATEAFAKAVARGDDFSRNQAAGRIRGFYNDAKTGKWFCGLVTAAALYGVAVAPNFAKVALCPVAALALLAGRDCVRAQRAANTFMQTPDGKKTLARLIPF